MSGGSPPPLVELSSATSTQEHARRLLQDGAAHGVAVVAREQTAGRGRRGRTWVSGPHGLWMSLVVRRALPMARAPRLPLVAADVVARVLVAHGVDARVKWPNDLLVPDATASSPLGPFRKVGGLLLEAVDIGPVDGVDGLALRGAVLGLGLNLRTPAGGFGPDIAATAGALSDVVDAFVVDDDALDTLRVRLAQELQQALARALPDDAGDDAFAAVRARLATRSATLGRRVHVEGTTGVAEALDGDGALLLRDDDGIVHTVFAGDVAVLGAGGEPAAGATLSSTSARR